MRRSPIVRSLLLAALLWLAQMQGVVHGISHLGTPGGGRELVGGTHTVVCSDCAAYAQAGVAPLSTAPDLVLEAPADAPLVFAPPSAGSAAAPVSYQSRAPPIAHV